MRVKATCSSSKQTSFHRENCGWTAIFTWSNFVQWSDKALDLAT